MLRILFLQKRLLFPADVGCKVRTLNVVRHLARWHDVTYLCNVHPEERPYLKAMEELGVRLETISWRERARNSAGFCWDLARNLASRYPFNVDKDYDVRLRARALELLTREPFDLLVCDFVQMARNAIGLPAPAKVLFQHNVEAEIFYRHSRQDKGRMRRWYMGRQWRKMRRFEGQAGQGFDRVVAISERDEAKFKEDYGWRHVRTIDTAVDTDYFRPRGAAIHPGRIVFVGSMDWLPNEDGVAWFVRRVWPLVRKVSPEATFQIVGRNPSAATRALAAVEGVSVTGTVDDVRPYLESAEAMVVPLLVGGGTRLKIYEAMSMGVAVVSTSLGAEGLPLKPEEHLLVADEPETLARDLIRVLSNRAERQRIAQTGMTFVHERFSAEQVARQFEQICLEVVEVESKSEKCLTQTR